MIILCRLGFNHVRAWNMFCDWMLLGQFSIKSTCGHDMPDDTWDIIEQASQVLEDNNKMVTYKIY